MRGVWFLNRWIVAFLICLGLMGVAALNVEAGSEARFWEMQAIDTMKTSRDRAREGWSEGRVAEELATVASVDGVTHVAIGTPYDDEFIPVLRLWVEGARKLGLGVWFRGNFSAWEGWYGYEKNMTREAHLEATRRFIANNADLFEDGDGFTACPECENGGPGDPRETGDVEGYRQFVVDQYQLANREFEAIDKKVQTNLFSMNGDIAKDVMDKNTYERIGGLVTVDHYVRTPEQFGMDLAYLHETFGVEVIVGEYGAPIPDLQGYMSQQSQAEFVGELMEQMFSRQEYVRGMSYWTHKQASTALFGNNGDERQVVDTLRRYWKPGTVVGVVQHPLSTKKLKDVRVVDPQGREVYTNEDGEFGLLALEGEAKLQLEKSGFASQEVVVMVKRGETTQVYVEMEPASLGWLDPVRGWWLRLVAWLY